MPVLEKSHPNQPGESDRVSKNGSVTGFLQAKIFEIAYQKS
jgi:hypothetical protein